MKEKYYHLAYQSSDRELHRTLKTLKKGIGR